MFRTDASSYIGNGHVMRCLSLAKALQLECVFVCRDLPCNLIQLIRNSGFLVHALPKPTEINNSHTNSWLKVTIKEDSGETITVLKKLKAKLLIVDHYGINHRWENEIRKILPDIKIVCIDDLANRKHSCEVIIDHNPYINSANRYDKLVPTGCKKLLGSKYTIINPKLEAIKTKRCSIIPKNHKEIFIYFGSTKQDETYLKILQSCIELKLNFHVFLGKNNNSHELNKLTKRYNNIKLYSNEQDYYKLLAMCGIAIGAGGVSSLERSYIGLPSLNISFAMNQEKLCYDQSQLGMNIYLGKVETINKYKILNNLKQITSSDIMRKKIIETGQLHIDGKGLSRLVLEIKQYIKR